jgi:hypothetical protein
MSSDNDNGEVVIDLTEKKYVGFIIHANPTPEMQLCSIMSADDMFPFRATPLEKKLKFNDVKKRINCETGEFVVLTPQLKKLGIREVIADEEGLCKTNPQVNVDASALCQKMGNIPLVGDVAFLKYKS